MASTVIGPTAPPAVAMAQPPVQPCVCWPAAAGGRRVGRPRDARSAPRRRFLGMALAACAPSADVMAAVAARRPLPTADPAGGANVERLRRSPFVLFGEVHDNAVQHRLRADLLGRLLADAAGPCCVVFEQMLRGTDAAIDAAPRDAESVATAGRLDRKAWAWPLHRPLLEAALVAGATVRGGDLDREQARAIVQRGSDAVPEALGRLLSTSGWQESEQAEVERDIEVSHCGALPKSLFAGMALAQRARDASLADAMLQAAAQHPRVILIAGNGHVRRDLGVPRDLIGAGVAPDAIVSVGYLEGASAGAPYDLVRVTPAAPRPDPCLAFRAPR